MLDLKLRLEVDEIAVIIVVIVASEVVEIIGVDVFVDISKVVDVY